MTTKYPHAGAAEVMYFEGNSFVGSRRHYCAGYEGVSAYWPHTAYFCPFCGEIWGRAIMNFEFDYAPIPKQPWVIEKRPCVKHGDGQFLCGVDDYFFDYIGKDLLTREILALMENYYERNNYSSPAA